MKKDIRGTVRVILNSRADKQAIEQYGDIWDVMVVGTITATLRLNDTIYTPQLGDIKEMESEDGKVYKISRMKYHESRRKYKSYRYIYDL